jgi:hypothetical protein
LTVGVIVGVRIVDWVRVDGGSGRGGGRVGLVFYLMVRYRECSKRGGYVIVEEGLRVNVGGGWDWVVSLKSGIGWVVGLSEMIRVWIR